MSMLKGKELLKYYKFLLLVYRLNVFLVECMGRDIFFFCRIKGGFLLIVSGDID